jgi:cobalt/nickel transport system permease protein
MVVMTAVVFMQALLFQDGGLDALGANVINMGILGCVLSGLVIGAGRRLGQRVFYLSVAAAAWISVVGAAISCAFELALSGTSPLEVVLPAMIVVHALIGIFEGIVTVVALRFIVSVKPDLVLFPHG